MACRLETWAEVVQQLAKLMPASIFSADMVRRHDCMGERVQVMKIVERLAETFQVNTKMLCHSSYFFV